MSRNYDTFPTAPPQAQGSYNFAQIVESDAALSDALLTELASTFGDEVIGGVNVTADSFYSSQGRIDPNFDDANETVIADIRAAYPMAKTLEMETFVLLHLAACSKVPIIASAASIVVANRCSAKVVDGDTLERLELEGGRAILNVITSAELPRIS